MLLGLLAALAAMSFLTGQAPVAAASAVPNDDFDAPTVVAAVPYIITQDVAGATTAQDDPPLQCSSEAKRQRTVWFEYTPPTAQALTIDTIGSDYDTVLAVWTGDRGSLTEVDCNDEAPGGLQSQIQLTPIPGTTYHIEVAAYADDPTTSQLTFRITGPAPQQMTVRSKGANDGWVLESGEQTTQGGSRDNASDTTNVGDDATDRQYRSILDFNTAGLPDNAVVVGVVFEIRSAGWEGVNPFASLGTIKVDIRRGGFGGQLGLRAGDFQAAASRLGVGVVGGANVDGWYTSDLGAAAYSKVNPTGHTQLRMRFSIGDDDDQTADFLYFYTGNAATADRPKLTISYYAP
jgi:hypothetical protein